MMDGQYCIQVRGSAFVFMRVGDGREVRFPTLSEAIKHGESLPEAQGSKLVVLSEKGVAAITLQL